MDDGGGGAVACLISIISLIIPLAIYLFWSYCIVLIAQKSGVENAWMGWIPIVQFIPLLTVAHKPVWWIVLLMIPIVSIVILIIVLMEVAQERGKPAWMGILTAFFPPLIALIAFGD